MKNKTIHFAHGLILLPFLTIGSPLAMFNTNFALRATIQEPTTIAISEADLQAEHAEMIDAYYEKRNMPLEGYGAKLAKVAADNDIDWRLLPAISIKESTGGKFACHNNPFGWGSCKIKFASFDEAIETVAKNLGGNNPKTARYYKDSTIEEILHHYNGSVIPAYPGEVMEFMELIEQGK